MWFRRGWSEPSFLADGMEWGWVGSLICLSVCSVWQDVSGKRQRERVRSWMGRILQYLSAEST